MPVHRTLARCGLLAAAFGASLALMRADPVERELNAWPAVVAQRGAAGGTEHWNAAGPLLFWREAPDGNGTLSGLRPLWIQRRDAQGQLRAGYFLYPLFSYTADETTYKWSLFELVRRTDRRDAAGPRQSGFEAGEFEIFPLWFSRQTGDPELSYRALFPVAGTIKNKLGFEQASWTLFPLYFKSRKRGVETTHTPWPIIRVTRGAARGFGIWPLYEKKEQPGRWSQETYLWPLGYNNTRQPAPDAPVGTPPARQVGFLPFYARHTGPGLIDENYLWPFFGYTHRTAPAAYHETRYFWPFFVQARSESKHVNRWAPFYTHSIVKGYDKTWYAWPVVRHAQWADDKLARERTQVLYFLYWSETQRSRTRSDAAPASLTHWWPLYSAWDDGAGRKQAQLFSPLEVFFPGNEKVRAAWTPLFAIYRREQSAPGQTRTSVLWNALSWRRDDARQQREFHAGPLFSRTAAGEARRYALGNGLVAVERQAGSGWHVRWLDFKSRSRPATPPPGQPSAR